MCIDNPREGFGELFDTHPPIEKRIQALMKFAGGHDPGPLALPEPHEEAEGAGAESAAQERIEQNAAAPAGTPMGPWGGMAQPDGAKPFLPAQPPINLGGGSSSGGGDPGSDPGTASGPWGPHRRN
jgi:heat shock protein HtpX